jgi:nodulation protein E
LTRVVVTGIGAVSACGIGADALWLAAREGRTAVRNVSFPKLPRQSVPKAARITDDSYEVLAREAQVRFQDRATVLALAAAREAVAQAGLTDADFGSQCGVIVGSGLGGAETLDRNFTRFIETPSARLDPMGVPKTMTSSSASWISMEWGVTGPTYCISTACSSSSQSIGLAADLVRSGAINRAIAGGTEALLFDSFFASWEALHVMTATECRPFSLGRNGMVLGEGAGIIVLESLEFAQARGAKVIAEVLSYACTSDGADLLRPNAKGAIDCMGRALQRSGLGQTEIGYINAHGTGTIANDQAETEALREIFGERLEQVAVSSTKPIHGHALGAAGALEFIITLCALREQIAPPTINFLDVDPRIGLKPVPNVALPFSAPAAMTNSFAFGGINSSLVVALADRPK